MTYNLEKGNIIISKVKKKYWRTTNKYGVRPPKNVMEAMYIYQENGNTYRKYSIDKYTRKDKISYKPIEDCTPEEVQKGKVDDMHGYQEIKCHFVFDAKMDFTWNYRFGANDSKTEALVSLT